MALIDMEAIDAIMDGDPAVVGALRELRSEAADIERSEDGRALPLLAQRDEWLR